jgi:hypothetical protein
MQTQVTCLISRMFPLLCIASVCSHQLCCKGQRTQNLFAAMRGSSDGSGGDGADHTAEPHVGQRAAAVSHMQGTPGRHTIDTEPSSHTLAAQESVSPLAVHQLLLLLLPLCWRFACSNRTSVLLWVHPQ